MTGSLFIGCGSQLDRRFPEGLGGRGEMGWPRMNGCAGERAEPVASTRLLRTVRSVAQAQWLRVAC